MRSSSTRVIRLTSTSTRAGRAAVLAGFFQGLEKWLYGPILGQQQLLPRPLTLVGVACQLLDQIVDGWPAGAGKYRE